MSRQSTRRRTIVQDYNNLQRRNAIPAAATVSVSVVTVQEETTIIESVHEATAIRCRSQRNRESIFTPPPLTENEVQCAHCIMRFKTAAGATQKHNRHHPKCMLFERDTAWDDEECLSYNALIQWFHTLTARELKEQLQMYYQKTSGNKEELLLRLENAAQAPPIDITVGSIWHRNQFTAVQLKQMCKEKGLDYLIKDGNDLYLEYFHQPVRDGSSNKTAQEKKEEEQDRLLVQQENRVKFDAYVKNNITDKIDQEKCSLTHTHSLTHTLTCALTR